MVEEGISGGSRTRFQCDDEDPGTDGGMFNVREVDKDKAWSLDVVRLRNPRRMSAVYKLLDRCGEESRHSSWIAPWGASCCGFGY